MCYPKPGPRCSAYARNQYVHAKAAAKRNLSFETTISVKEAEEMFFTTPAGFRELKRMISIGEQVELNTAKLAHFKQVRADQLAALKVKDEGDIAHPEHSKDADSGPVNLLPLPDADEPREGWNVLDDEKRADREKAYIDASSAWVDTLSPNEIAAVRWFTSNGFSEMGQLDRGLPLPRTNNQTETDEEQKARIVRMRKTLNRALNKAPQQARIVYRGMSTEATPEELMEVESSTDSYHAPQKKHATPEAYEAAKDAYYEKLKNSGPISFNRPISATEDPKVGAGFARGQYNPSVMYEISVKKGAPAAVASAWGASEAEIILPANQQYKVVGVNKNATVKGRDRRGNPWDRKVTIIQLEEI